MLPRGAVPVSNRPVDEALKEVAEGIRLAVEKVVDRRRRQLATGVRPGSVGEGRVLDAAIALEISVGEFRDVVALVRLSRSTGLQRVLSPDSIRRSGGYSCNPTDVRGAPFEAKYTLTATQELISLEDRLVIHAPSLITKSEEKKFVLERM